MTSEPASAPPPHPREPVATEGLAEPVMPAEPRVEPPDEPRPENTADGPSVAVPAGTSAGSNGPVRLLGYLAAGIVGVALTLGVLAGSGSIRMASVESTAPPSAAPTALPTPRQTFGFDGYAMGVASAPVTVEIWADFQCPYCGLMAHGIEPALIREIAVSGKARIQYRDFAFLGQESIDAAVAASCADRQGLFWRYHDLLFASQSGENQGAFARDRLVSLAKYAGMADTTAFTACLDDPTVAKNVAAETAEGRSYGVKSTPTIRIVGPGPTQLLEGVADPTKILAAVDKASTAAPASGPGSASSPTPDPSSAPSTSSQ